MFPLKQSTPGTAYSDGCTWHSSPAAVPSKRNQVDARTGTIGHGRVHAISGRSSTRAPKPNSTPVRCRSRQVFGLPGSADSANSYCMPLPKPRVGFSAKACSFPVTAAGSSGFAPDSLLATIGWHRNKTQDIVFEGSVNRDLNVGLQGYHRNEGMRCALWLYIIQYMSSGKIYQRDHKLLTHAMNA